MKNKKDKLSSNFLVGMCAGYFIEKMIQNPSIFDLLANIKPIKIKKKGNK